MEQREGGDIFLHDFIQEEISGAGHGQGSEIRNFFEGATVFITGATGFLGQAIVEKLLRLTEVKKIYVLVRSQGTKSPKERVRDVLHSVLFTAVTHQRPDVETVVAAVPGDCGLPQLGLTDTDRELLMREVDVVIHAAATPHSDDDFRTALLVNVRGTRFLLQLAKEMRHIKSFIYVSSAYSNSHLLKIKEVVYPASINYEKLLSLIDILDDENLDLIKPNLLRGWTNIQTFSRHVAEDLVRDQESGLPVGIFRPSIAVSTAFEPLVGWVNNAVGPQAAAFNAMAGIMRVFHATEQFRADLVPVDLSASALLAFASEVGSTSRYFGDDSPNIEDLSKIESGFRPEAMVPVLNFVSGRANGITWGHFIQLCFLYGLSLPKLSDFSVPNLSFESNELFVILQQWIYHYLPAAFFDGLLYITGNKPKWISTYKKLHSYSESFAPFSTKQWQFQDRNVATLWNKLGAKDKALFNFNLASIDWNEYMKMYVRGIRTYIGKENMETLPAAKRRMKKLEIIYYGGKAIAAVALFYLLYRIHLSF